MSQVSEEQVINALANVIDPELQNNLVELNMVKEVLVQDNNVEATIELTSKGCPLKSQIESDCRTEIKKIEGVQEIKINLTSRPVPEAGIKLPNIKHIIAISSGKGGVGKSTMAINIAFAFRDAGYKVGLMDGDVYGPNIPTLLDNHDQPEVQDENHIYPIDHQGIKFISIGSLLPPNQPVIWRGPILHGVVKQFLSDVVWGDLDFLFVDLPPGTGDVQLSLCQTVNLSGSIVVTTPQKLSVTDVRKGIAMFRQLQVDILGIIENMSYYLHPGSQEKIYVFGKGGGEELAKEWNIPLLSQVPIDPEMSENSEKGIKYIAPAVNKILEILAAND